MSLRCMCVMTISIFGKRTVQLSVSVSFYQDGRQGGIRSVKSSALE